jgi:hypothetical protein
MNGPSVKTATLLVCRDARTKMPSLNEPGSHCSEEDGGKRWRCESLPCTLSLTFRPFGIRMMPSNEPLAPEGGCSCELAGVAVKTTADDRVGGRLLCHCATVPLCGVSRHLVPEPVGFSHQRS